MSTRRSCATGSASSTASAQAGALSKRPGGGAIGTALLEADVGAKRLLLKSLLRERSRMTPDGGNRNTGRTRIRRSRPGIFVVLGEVVEDFIPRSLRPDEHVGSRLERWLVG